MLIAILLSWLLFLVLGVALTWLLRGDTAFSFGISGTLIAFLWAVYFMFPMSDTFL